MSLPRLFACALWLAACMGLGFHAGQRVRRRWQVLESFYRFFGYLGDTMLPLSLTLPQACERFCLHETGPAAVFARELAKSLQEGNLQSDRYETLLDEVLASEDVSLKDEDRKILVGASACLNAQSERELESILAQSEQDARLLAQDAKNESETKARLYRTLGFMAGALAVIWAA